MTIKINPIGEIMRNHQLGKGSSGQKFIDTAVVRYCDPYVPMDTGTLKKAIGTVYGDGEVKYNTTYARRNYDLNRGMGNQGTARGGFRGAKWFERMKAAKLFALAKEVAEYLKVRFKGAN